MAEQVRRKIEGLRLYEPMRTQAEFHASTAKERILRGSNRSGKTVGAAVEVARACTGQDPYGKYPLNDGVCYCVGKDGREVGQVMWRKLSRAGAFRIIRDSVTGLWRAWRPNDPADASRRHETKLAPPLIPPRFIKEISWENKKESLPKIVRLTTGWELHFFSSLGKPPHGADIDLAWFDEEIIDKDWYPEIAARLVDRSGHFLWSATPQAGTEQLYELHERASQKFDAGGDPGIQEFIILLEDNEFLTEQQKKDFASKLSDEERAVRVGGEFALLSFKIFPEYNRLVHNVEYFDIPSDWTRYLAVDPGRQICAVLFMAIPPPEHGDFAYIYDELYIQNCDAEMFGQRMAAKCQGQRFHSFLIDHQQGRVVEMGGGRSIEDLYSAALRKYKVYSDTTGHNFEWGSTDRKADVEAIRLWLRKRDDGTPKLRVIESKVPNFVDEIKRWRYKKIDRVVSDVPEDRGRVHLMATLRYLVQFNPRFVVPKAGKVTNPVIQALRRKQEKKNQGKPLVFLGPGS